MLTPFSVFGFPLEIRRVMFKSQPLSLWYVDWIVLRLGSNMLILLLNDLTSIAKCTTYTLQNMNKRSATEMKIYSHYTLPFIQTFGVGWMSKKGIDRFGSIVQLIFPMIYCSLLSSAPFSSEIHEFPAVSENWLRKFPPIIVWIHCITSLTVFGWQFLQSVFKMPLLNLG